MSQQATVLMEGDFKDYTLNELLEVTSLCRQLIQVNLSRESEPQGRLLLKAGQLLEAQIISSAQSGLQAFQSLLSASFDRFRVVKLPRQSLTRDPIGRLIDLMVVPVENTIIVALPEVLVDQSSDADSSLISPPSPPSPSLASPPSPSLASPPSPPSPSLASPPSPSLASPPSPSLASPPSTSLASPPSPPSQSLASPPSPSLASPPSPSLASTPSPLSPLPTRPALKSAHPSPTSPRLAPRVILPQTSLPASPQTSLHKEDATRQHTPWDDDHAETSIFSGAEVSELISLIGTIDQQREMLSSIYDQCQTFNQNEEQLHTLLRQQKEMITRLQSSSDQRASREESQAQVLHNLTQHLGESRRAQHTSLNQLLGYTQQAQALLEGLQRDVQRVNLNVQQHLASPPDSQRDAFGPQMLLELARGQDHKKSSHLTPLMIVSLFIQVIALILISVIAFKTLL